MALRWVRVLPGRKECQFRLPMMSDGKNGSPLILKEEYCILPAGHDGPHRGPHGQLIHNAPGAARMFERGEF